MVRLISFFATTHIDLKAAMRKLRKKINYFLQPYSRKELGINIQLVFDLMQMKAKCIINYFKI